MNRHTLLVVLGSAVTIFLLIWALIAQHRASLRAAEGDEKLHQYELQVERLKGEMVAQDCTISAGTRQIDMLNLQIEKQQRDLRVIRYQYDQKIRNISRYTPTELDSFFASRYN